MTECNKTKAPPSPDSPRPVPYVKPFVLFLAVAWMLLVFCILSGCQRQEATPYKVVDSGIWPLTTSIQKTFWLDNERVVFISKKTLSPGPGPNIITTWNPITGRVEFSHQLTHLICVQDGQVFFATKDISTGKRKYYRGPVDNVQEYPPPGPNMRIDDRFDCGWAPGLDRKVPYRIKLKGDNYLEITKESNVTDRSRESCYYERPGLSPTPLPMHVDIAAAHYAIRFNQLRNAYFISPAGYMPGDPHYRSMWWLSRDGHLTHVPFPKKVIWPSQGGLEIHPLRDGYLVLYSGGKMSATDPGPRGLYLIQGDHMEKVLLGSIHGVSISSDGCRAAFNYARNIKEDLSRTKPYRTVKTINFCEGRKEQ